MEELRFLMSLILSSSNFLARVSNGDPAEEKPKMIEVEVETIKTKSYIVDVEIIEQ